MDLRSKTDLLQFCDLDIEQILQKNNKNIEDVEKDVIIVRNWMEQQKHLPFVFDDRQIFSFLVISNFSLENAKTRIDMYFTLKGVFPELYSFNLDHPKLKTFQKNYNLIPMPKLSKNLGRIVISQPIDVSYYDCQICCCLFLYLLEVLQSEDVNIGMEIILDFRFASTEMLDKISTELIIKMVVILEKIYINSIFSIHILTSAATENFMPRLWKTVNENFAKKFIMHKNLESLMDYFSKDMLPKDFAGDLKSLNEFNVDWQKYLQDQSENLEKQMNARTDENLRTFQIVDKEVLNFIIKNKSATVET